jgi:hypothetical protein
MSEDINVDRRRFCGTAVVALAAAHFSMLGPQDAQSSEATRADVPPVMTGTNTSFGLLKQIDAGVLNIGYAESGPSLGPAVILLHGYSQLCRCRPSVGIGGLQSDRPLRPRLWHDALSLE